MLRGFDEYGIGNTPIVELPRVNGNRIIIKLEMQNFLKSIKARTAYWIIKNCLQMQKIKLLWSPVQEIWDMHWDIFAGKVVVSLYA